MVKKTKKLTDEEIEEYRNETYQMMAAMSGKQVSELMGEPSNRPNFTKNYCIIKQLYLKNCVNPIGSKELYELLQKQGYDAKYSTFRGLTNYYMKNGYIRKTNAKKPFLYVLTEEGKLHIKNPFIKIDENIQRYRNTLLQKMKELIEGEPELFKSIYESVVGIQNSSFYPSGSPSGSQYSPNDIGSELQQELESQIFTPDFFKNADEGKLKSLVNGILDNSLSDEQKKQLILDVIDQARTNKTMIFKQQEYNSKPIGERNYYSILVNATNEPVTKALYEKIPFRFIYIQNKNELRLESESIAGKYRNNKDAMFIDFDLVNQRFFYNKMQIKTRNNGKELEFYYVIVDIKGVWGFNRKITTMSFADYNKALKKSEKQSVKISVQMD